MPRQMRNAGMPSLLLTFEDPADRSDQLLEQRPRVPAVERDLVAGGEIGLEVAAQPRGARRCSRNATFTSSLCSNDRLSTLVVPITAHVPSTISALTCVIAGRYS